MGVSRIGDFAGSYLLVQVGPAGASGGIAHVMMALDQAARADGRPALIVNTSCDGPLARRVGVGLAGVARAALVMAFARRALVHVHSASNGSFVRKTVVVLVARAFGRPLLLQIHGGGFASFATGSSLRRRWVSRVLRQCGAVVVLNETIRQVVASLAPSVTVRVVPNPATLLCGATSDPRSTQVLFLGRLGPAKGTDALLTAIRDLQLAGVDADYVLAGDGEVEAARAVVARLPDPARARVPGWVDREVVHELLHESSVFCLPSNFEGLPMALLQAMGHGLACVVTPVGAMGEVVVDGVNGLLVPQNDPPALAAALERLLRSPELRGALGQAAHTLVLERYSPQVVVQSLRQIYATLPRGGRTYATE